VGGGVGVAGLGVGGGGGERNPAELLDGLTRHRLSRPRQGGHEESARGPVANSQDGGLAAWDLVEMDRYRAVWLQAHG